MTEKQKHYIEWIEAYVEVPFEKSGLTVSEYIDKYAHEAHTQFELDGIIQENING